MEQLLSMNPDTFTAGGLLDDADVEVVGGSYELFDYGGNADDTMAARLELKDLTTGETQEQHWSLGDPKDYETVEDGNGIKAAGSVTGFRKSSNWGIFLIKLKEIGYPVDRMPAKMSDIFGLCMHVGRIPSPERAGLSSTNTSGRPKTVLVPQKLIRLPWEKAAGAAARRTRGAGTTAGAARAAAPAPVTAGGEDNEAMASAVLTELLAANGNSMGRMEAKRAMYAHASIKTRKADDKNKVVGLLSNDEWLITNGFDINSKEQLSAVAAT